jgi:hypothetical protein
MTGLLNVEVGLRGVCASLLLYSVLTTHLAIAFLAARPSLSTYVCISSVPSPTLTSLRTILTSLAARLGSSSRSCSSGGPTRSSCASRPMHRFPRDARLHRFRVCTLIPHGYHTDRDLRPLLVEPPPRTSREELQTTSCTPLRLTIVPGGYDGRDFSHDTWCLNIRECAPRLFLLLSPLLTVIGGR